MDHQVRLNSLPIVEDDTVVQLDHQVKAIRVGTALNGEINHIPTSPAYEGKGQFQWIGDFKESISNEFSNPNLNSGILILRLSDGLIRVMWHSNFEKQRIHPTEVREIDQTNRTLARLCRFDRLPIDRRIWFKDSKTLPYSLPNRCKYSRTDATSA